MFSKATFSDVGDLAIFCAGLAREGVTFTVRPAQSAGCYDVIVEEVAR